MRPRKPSNSPLQVPGSRVDHWPGVGHYLHEEHPESIRLRSVRPTVRSSTAQVIVHHNAVFATIAYAGRTIQVFPAEKVDFTAGSAVG